MSIIYFKTKCIAIYNFENIELKDFKKFIRIVLNINKLKISMFNSFFVKKKIVKFILKIEIESS